MNDLRAVGSGRSCSVASAVFDVVMRRDMRPGVRGAEIEGAPRAESGRDRCTRQDPRGSLRSVGAGPSSRRHPGNRGGEFPRSFSNFRRARRWQAEVESRKRTSLATAARGGAVRGPASAPREPRHLPECERVGFGAGREKRDLQRPVSDPVALAHELVEAAVVEHSVSVLVDVDAVGACRVRSPSTSDAERDRRGSCRRASTRWASRAWNRQLIVPPARSRTTALAADRPPTAKRPLFTSRLLGSLVGVAGVEGGMAVRVTNRSLRP